MKSPLTLLFQVIPLAGIILASSASAQLLVSYAENPDSVNSTLQNTNTYDFNNLSTGQHDGAQWSGVGTFDHLYILAADEYGGAADASHPNGSNYSVQSNTVGGGAVNSTTLTLNSEHAYFGFWWSAGDATNVLSFYKGADLVAQYSTQTLLDVLAAQPGYKGNPINRSQNSSQSYAFINFLGLDGATWDKIVLTNLNSSGFESDNYTDRAAAWTQAADGDLPGVPVAIVNGTTVTQIPEASTSLLVASAGLLAAFRRRRSA
ncbi:MAG: hypothetical protein JWO82_2366 [Akkermansiaceae bacterium]|nr:hypothetical protein [Akkermansiaceae bacterium]